jgi:HD-GYP domain-containing protein (c-di-GMP phosphodiesterase class II)
VADVYHTLRSVRAYRAAFTHEQAMEILQQEVGRGWWDAGIVQILNDLPIHPEESFEIL